MKKYKYTRVLTFEGKKYYIRGDTLEEVIEKKALKLRDLEEGRVVLNRTTLVKVWAETMLETYKSNVGDKTRYNNSNNMKKHILSYIGNMPISSVKPVHCQQILNNLSGYSNDTIRKVYQLLKLLFRTACDNSLIVTDPTRGITKPEGYTNKRRSITESERSVFLKVCYSDVKYIPFLFMLFCGCRPAEALAIRANDIQEVKGIKVLHIRGTKTENADRYVPVPLDFLAYVEANTPGGFDLFSCRKDGGLHNESSYRALIKSLKREMNILLGARVYRNQLVEPLPLAPDFTPYMLRHTYCTDLKKAGVPLGIAKDYMGHSTIELTANIYSHSDEDTLLAGAAYLGITPEGATKGATLKGRKMS